MQQLFDRQTAISEFRKENWQEHRLGELFDERDEMKRTDLPLLSVTADEVLISRDDVDRKDSPARTSRLQRIARGDIGYNSHENVAGRIAVSSLEGIVSPAYTICIPRATVDAEFAGYLFKYPNCLQSFATPRTSDDTLSLKVFISLCRFVRSVSLALNEQRKRFLRFQSFGP